MKTHFEKYTLKIDGHVVKMQKVEIVQKMEVSGLDGLDKNMFVLVMKAITESQGFEFEVVSMEPLIIQETRKRGKGNKQREVDSVTVNYANFKAGKG